MILHVRGIVILDTRLNAFDSKRNCGPLCGLNELLFRNGPSGDDDAFIGRFFLLEGCNMSRGNVPHVDPVARKIKLLVAEDWIEEKVEPPLRGRIEIFGLVDLVQVWAEDLLT